ncbi:uncharacterized protein N7500_005615 [Penicillium coprophilum]|uniref:uncharacterized protein n=1 Tax=Penicillium coprophilum TaxID=36646 RepID=UPI0023909AE5|nr:uncharacterized protein N7500_005615 [Penicillium coprophilum]KAJ5163785.1 hypothetical protein N7500_005615 [Penicillium coprophilum]
MDGVDYYLKAVMSANAQTDIVLDTWNTAHLGPHIRPVFGKDTWTWDSVLRLQSPMGDVDLDVVYGVRKIKELRRWEVSLQSWYTHEMHGDGCGYSLMDDPDL